MVAITLSLIAALGATSALAHAIPVKRWEYQQYFDLQGHRGGRGEAIEDTLWGFAHGLMDGVTTLELDVGISKDGEAIVWHDESFTADKCRDTANAINDPMYPYVGKYIANLTLAQIKTLDCGSNRLAGFPYQLTLPGQKISTLQEFFDFVKCTSNKVLFNIESKVDGDFRNLTRSPEDFVDIMLPIFEKNDLDRILFQSFDWRTLILSKAKLPELRTSALFDDTTLWKYPEGAKTGNLSTHGLGPSNWLAGIDIDSFNGSTVAERVVQAAASIGADVISPAATSYATPSTALDPGDAGYIALTNQTMVDAAHALGIKVAPWTPNRLNIIKYLLDINVDSIITDYPAIVRRYIEQRGGYKLAPLVQEDKVMKCLAKHVQYTSTTVSI